MSKSVTFENILQLIPQNTFFDQSFDKTNDAQDYQPIRLTYKSLLKQSCTEEDDMEYVRKANPKLKFQETWKRVSSFRGLPTIRGLKTLDVSETKILSFEDALEQPDLEHFYCKNTSLAEYEYLGLMAKVVFGLGVNYVNKVAIDTETHILAVSIREKLRPVLISGSVVTSINPIRILDVKTRRRRLFFIDPTNREEKPKEEKSSKVSVKGDAEKRKLEEQKQKESEKKAIQKDKEERIRKQIRIEMMKTVYSRQQVAVHPRMLISTVVNEFPNPRSYLEALPESEYQVIYEDSSFSGSRLPDNKSRSSYRRKSAISPRSSNAGSVHRKSQPARSSPLRSNIQDDSDDNISENKYSKRRQAYRESSSDE